MPGSWDHGDEHDIAIQARKGECGISETDEGALSGEPSPTEDTGRPAVHG